MRKAVDDVEKEMQEAVDATEIEEGYPFIKIVFGIPEKSETKAAEASEHKEPAPEAAEHEEHAPKVPEGPRLAVSEQAQKEIIQNLEHVSVISLKYFALVVSEAIAHSC